MVKKYMCNDWSEVPSYLKTKTSLNKMGIFHLSKPCAVVEIYGQEYKLYNVNTCLKIEQKRGNKSLVINSQTKEHYLICEVETTGRGETDEITKLLIMDLDGEVLYFEEFNRDVKWKHEWRIIFRLMRDKILLIPHTIYFERLFRQTCEKYGVDIDFQINAICSSNHLQYKLSILSILKPEPEVVKTDLKKSCYQLLETIYPSSKIFYLRRKSFIYFDKLCEYKVKQGDINGKNKGKQWLLRDYGSNDFSDFSYEVSKEIIDLIYPILKGLGCLPRKF